MITSTKNDVVKELIKLQQKKYRKQNSLAIIEGQKFVLEALKLGFVKQIFASQTFLLNNSLDCEAVVLADNVFAQISTLTTPQGILATIKTDSLQMSDENAKQPSTNFLVLDRLQDPANMGAIVRSAVAFGFLNIFVIDCADIFSAKSLQASVGTILKIKYKDIKQEQIPTGDGIILVAAHMNGQTDYKVPTGKTIGIVVGNEGSGVNEELLKKANVKMSIAMKNDVDSLNAAVAASLIMHKFV